MEAKNRGWKALVLLFDIMGAFDKVWHEGLLHKLIKIGTPIYIINWVKGFLETRSFDVRVKDAYSDKKYIECGVPQGAVLSPILFAIYINDAPIKDAINDEFNLLFADDLCYIKLFKSIKQVEQKVNLYLKI